MINPFVGRGRPVSGDRLVGRDREKARLTEKVTSGSNLSLVGLPRIGKTSLARFALQAAGQARRIVAEISLDSCSGPAEAFNRIGFEINENIEDPTLVQAGPVLDANEEIAAYERLKDYLRKHARKGHFFTVAIDEFDYVSNELFSNANIFISRLREIANNYDRFHTSFVFVSRRTLDSIQGRVDCSTLAGLCETIFITGLSEDGLMKMVSRLNEIPHNAAEVSNAVWTYTGGHPYLSEVLLCEAVDQFLQLSADHPSIDKTAIENAIFVQAQEFTSQYRQLQHLLSQDDLLKVLMQLVLGIRKEVIDPHSVATLRNYGLIHRVNSEGYDAFSSHCADYLRLMDRVTPVWDVLGNVERDLRILVSQVFTAKYGAHWADFLSNKDESTRKLFSSLKDQRDKERKQFGNTASDAILDYTYISDIRALVFSEWNEFFSKIFKKNKAEWQLIFDHVVKVRNPAAHFRDIPSSAITQAERALADIKEIISEYQASA